MLPIGLEDLVCRVLLSTVVMCLCMAVCTAVRHVFVLEQTMH